MKKIYWIFISIVCMSLGFAVTRVLSQPTDAKGDLATPVGDLSHLNSPEAKELLSTFGIDSNAVNNFSWAKVGAWVIFGGIGFIAFVYGKKQENLKPLMVGILLMVYPYFVSETLWLYAVGTGLCAALYFWRD